MKSRHVCSPVSNQVNIPYSKSHPVFMGMPFGYCHSAALKVDTGGEKGFDRQSMSCGL